MAYPASARQYLMRGPFGAGWQVMGHVPGPTRWAAPGHVPGSLNARTWQTPADNRPNWRTLVPLALPGAQRPAVPRPGLVLQPFQPIARVLFPGRVAGRLHW